MAATDPADAPKAPPTTAHVLAVFAKELEEEGFSQARITALLPVALERIIRDDDLMLFDV